MLLIYFLIFFTISTHHVTGSLNNVTKTVKTQENTQTVAQDTVIIERYPSGTNLDEVAAVQFLKTHDKQASEECRKVVEAEWNYATNITEENKNTLVSFYTLTTFEVYIYLCFMTAKNSKSNLYLLNLIALLFKKKQ
jgi:PREDICTED: similar to angiotensin I converting enzyme (peptidyl-dipeptidase A) 1 isoform 1